MAREVDPNFIVAGRGERDVILGEKWSDPSSQKLFKLWKEDGRIPERFNSWEEINAEIAAIKKENPKIERKALMDKLGWSKEYTHRHNVLGNSFMNKDGLIRRNIRDDLNIVSERLIFKNGGQEAVDAWRAKVKSNWFSLRPNERKALEELFETRSFKKKAWAKGHNFASLMGGDTSFQNIRLQIGDWNTALGSRPRFPIDIMQFDWGVPPSSSQAYFNEIVNKSLKNRDTIPRGLLQHLAETGRLNPDTLERVEHTLQELTDQGITYSTNDIVEALDETGGIDTSRIGQFQNPEELDLAKVARKADDEWNFLRRVGLADNKLINTLMKGGDEAIQAWRKVPAPVRAGIKAAPLITLGVLFDHLEVQARQADHAEEPSLINKIDLGMAHTSQVLGGASAVGFVPAELPQAIVSGAQMISDEFQNTDRERPFSQYGPMPTSLPLNTITQQSLEADKQQQKLDEYYSAGGGNAAMVKHGWSIEQTQEQGRKNLNKQFLATPERTD